MPKIALFLFSLLSIQIQFSLSAPNGKNVVENGGGKMEEKIFWRFTEGKERKLLMRARVQMLANSPDNEIYRATPLEWEGGNVGEDVAIKIVNSQIKLGYVRKDFAMIAHEVEMLKLARKSGSEHVIKLFEAHIFKGSVYMVIELGEEDMAQILLNLQNKWEKLGEIEWAKVMGKGRSVVWMDVHKLLLDMATALADFNKFEIHLALKPKNWLYVKGTLKLIDLQTAIPSDKRNWDTFFWKYACKGPGFKSPNFHRTPASKYASPEHKKFCTAITKEGENIDPIGLTTASDIWSFGVLICEILQKTPQIAANAEKWSWSEMEYIVHRRELIQFEIMARAIGDPDWANSSAAAKKLSEEIVGLVTKEFPHIFVLLKSIFRHEPAARPSALSIQIYLEKISKINVHEELSINEMEEIMRESIREGAKKRKRSENSVKRKIVPKNSAKECKKQSQLDLDSQARLIEEVVVVKG